MNFSLLLELQREFFHNFAVAASSQIWSTTHVIYHSHIVIMWFKLVRKLTNFSLVRVMLLCSTVPVRHIDGLLTYFIAIKCIECMSTDTVSKTDVTRLWMWHILAWRCLLWHGLLDQCLCTGVQQWKQWRAHWQWRATLLCCTTTSDGRSSFP
jgi:hypothetical protein